MPKNPRSRSLLFGVLPRPERAALAQALRTETVGGLLLLGAAAVALIWANTPNMRCDPYQRAWPSLCSLCSRQV